MASSPIRSALARVFAALMVALATHGVHAGTVTYEMVDMLNTGTISNYRIGKYEVTIGQYCDFLNAVAKQSDPYGLFSTSMATGTNGGVVQSGSPGSWTYSPRAPQGVQSPYATASNRPISFVSWFDAARFANWMSNGQGSGSTETGAYELNGITSGPTPARNPTAAFFIPTTSEWARAAYYSPTLNSGSGGYFTYATCSDASPANIPGSVPNSANLRVNVYSVTQSSNDILQNQNYLTDSGAFAASMSPNGTFDQTGNVSEWTSTDGLTSQKAMGGSWRDAPGNATSSKTFPLPATMQLDNVGFRLAGAYVPPPPPPPAPIIIDVPTGRTLIQSQSEFANPALDGVRPVQKIGGGTFVVDQANPLLTGSFTIQSGTAMLSHADAVANSLQVPESGGTLAIASTLHVHVGGITLQSGGRVDVGGGRITAPALLRPAAEDALRRGRGDGTWAGGSGITSSDAARAAQITPRSVGWLDNGDGSLTMAYAAAGDTNLDWRIDVLDVADFVAGGKFNTGDVAAWGEGDFNYDAAFDTLDIADFFATGLYDAGTYHRAQASGIAAVPEPGGMAIIGCVAAALALITSRQRPRW